MAEGGQTPVWHVANDDGSSYELAEGSLIERVGKGDLPKDTLVWKTGMADWQPAGRVFSRYFAPPPVPPSVIAAAQRSPKSGRRLPTNMMASWRFLFFSFRGRINRAKFWIGQLITLFWLLAVSLGFGVMINFVAKGERNIAPEAAFQEALGTGLLVGAITITVGLLWLVPMYAVAIKRLHDRNRSGWWSVVFYVLPGLLSGLSKNFESGQGAIFSLAGAAVGIWGFVEMGCLPGTRGTNRFGRGPLARGPDQAGDYY